jgi:starch synthase
MRDPHGDINMMQIGLYTCDLVSTVSPTYAKEILRPDFGEQLEHDLMTVGVTGIVNGVDTDVFNPETDTGIHQQFSVATVLEHKPKNTEVLRQQTQLPHQNGPLFGFIGRFTEQKGLDVLVQALPDIVALQGQVLVLGSGAADLEASMRSLQERYPDSIRVIERFDAVLAQQMYAGLDALLMPSRFEPCGLGQLIAMRYGTIPIVADTGGLHDTVVDVRTDAEHGTGYVVERTSSTALVSAIEHFTEHRKNIQWLSALIQRSMKRDSSWYTSAHAYHQLYAEATKKHSAHRV